MTNYYEKVIVVLNVGGVIDTKFLRAQKGIFVGYRYFDSFGITPAYPFGYGSSYTSFEVTTQNVCVDKNEVKVTVTVRNMGNFTGREVLQVYVSAPEGKLEKPYQELRAYAKTKDIVPGEEQTLELSWKVENMASYDEGHACWKLEAGTYYVRIGVNSRDTHIVAVSVDERSATIDRKTCH